MVKTLINNELYLSYPDGFHEMDASELKATFLDDNPNRWGIKDENRHMLITVLWNKTNMLSAIMVGPQAVAYSAERKLSASLNKSNYKSGAIEQVKLGGRNCYRFAYKYFLENVEQIGEVLVMQNVNHYYTLYTYALKKNEKAARVVIDAVVNSLKFTNDK